MITVKETASLLFTVFVKFDINNMLFFQRFCASDKISLNSVFNNCVPVKYGQVKGTELQIHWYVIGATN